MRKPITPGQEKAYERLMRDLFESIPSIALTQLAKDGEIDFYGLRQVLGNGNLLKPHGINFLKHITRELSRERVGVLVRLFADEVLDVPATIGHETILDSGVFRREWVAPQRHWPGGKPTAPTQAKVFLVNILPGERTSNEFLLESLGGDRKKQCWQESQIVKFCQRYRRVIDFNGFAILPMESAGSIFFAEVVNGGAVSVMPYFENSKGAVGDGRQFRFIVPNQDKGENPIAMSVKNLEGMVNNLVSFEMLDGSHFEARLNSVFKSLGGNDKGKWIAVVDNGMTQILLLSNIKDAEVIKCPYS